MASDTSAGDTAANGNKIGLYLGSSIVAAVIASAAAYVTVLLGLEVWVMFAGLVAFFTRPSSAPQALATFTCVSAGLVLGVCGVITLAALQPSLGPLAVALVVFLVGVIVVSMRALKPFDNIPAWFLGLIVFFAAHLDPAISSVIELGSAAAIGCAAGWIAFSVQSRMTPSH